MSHCQIAIGTYWLKKQYRLFADQRHSTSDLNTQPSVAHWCKNTASSQCKKRETMAKSLSMISCWLDWLQSLKQCSINVSYHIPVASLILMALFKKNVSYRILVASLTLIALF